MERAGEGAKPRPLFTAIETIAPYVDRGYVVLTANRRLSRAVRSADEGRRIEGGHRVWSSATIMPVRQFWTEQWQIQVTRGALPAASLLTPAQQLRLWERIIDDDRSPGFSLLSARRAAELCQRAFEQLLLWRVDRRSGPARDEIGADEDSRAFVRWADAFESACGEIGMRTPEQVQAELLEACEKDPDRLAPLPPLLLLYLDDLPPLYRDLAASAPDRVTVDLPPPRAQLSDVLAFDDEDSELAAAAAWARECATRDLAGRYAVVLPDMRSSRARLETQLRREFGCLTSNYDSLPVNFATGFSLDRVPLVRDALRILSLYARQVSVEDAVAVLHSRFVRRPQLSPELLEPRLQRLRDLSAERVPGTVLREVLGEPFGTPSPLDAAALMTSRGSPIARRRPPSAWLRPFRELLDAWHWAEGAALDSLEYQQRQHWEDALDAFALLDPIVGKLGFEQAQAELRALLAERPFQPQTTDRAVQVLGPLETTGLDFDGLWLLGMDANTWPPAAKPNPYLPISLQRRERMPGADALLEWQRARRRWQHWLAGAGQLRASYVSVKDEAEQLPSPLLEGLPIEYSTRRYEHDARWDAQRGSLSVVALAPAPVQDDERAADGVGSAVLEAQAECPFKAFAAARLRAGPPAAASAGVLPSERGSMLHRALFALFGEFASLDALRTASEARVDGAIEGATAEARRVLRAERRAVLGSGVLDLEARRLATLLRAWLAVEAARSEPFDVVERESERVLELAGLTLRLRLDRLDRFADGRELLIDYKSGRPESLKRWFEEIPSRPQLPLYALLDPPPAGICYAVLRPGELAWTGIGEDGFVDGLDPASKWTEETDDEVRAMEAHRGHWAESIAGLARDFIAGDAAVAPLRDACGRCGRQALCRIGDALR